MSSPNSEPSSALPREVIEGEARLFDLLYLRVSQGDTAVSAAVVQTIDATGPMKALWIMASVNVARRRQRMSLLTAPFRLFRQPKLEPSSDEALLALAEAVRKKLDPTEAAVKAA
jgi:hypothetical protein